jgi:hypothetical protein
MPKVIKFYVPKHSRKPLRSAPQQRGRVIEFRSPANKSTERSPFIIWKLAGSRKRNAVLNAKCDKPLPARTLGFAFGAASID